MRAPISGWRRISAYSSSVSAPGLLRIASGTPILPMSCSRPAMRTRSTSRASMPSCSAIIAAYRATVCECDAVPVSRRSRASARPMAVTSRARSSSLSDAATAAAGPAACAASIVRLRPPRLALERARSAATRSSSSVSPSRGYIAMPNDIVTAYASSPKASMMSRRRRSASATASETSAAGARIANSSPPVRPVMSSRREPRVTTSAAPRSTRSPAVRPCASLMRLSSSRSPTMSAQLAPAACATCAAARRSKPTRLSRPVSASVRAVRSSLSWRARCCSTRPSR